jgi:hypothetical protein
MRPAETPLPPPDPGTSRRFFASTQDENGVDMTLILENLRLTPRERLVKAELGRLQALKNQHAKRVPPAAA